jgi:hypothetical protein
VPGAVPARQPEQIGLDPIGHQGHPVLGNGLHLEQLGPDAMGDHRHVLGPLRQPPVTGCGQQPLDRGGHEGHRILRQLRGEQRVHVEDHRDPSPQTRHRADDQSLEVVRVDHVHPLAAKDTGQFHREHRVEQQQLSVGGTGGELVVAGDRADPTDVHPVDRLPAPVVVGHHHDPVTPLREPLGQPLDPDRRPSARREGARRNDRDRKPRARGESSVAVVGGRHDSFEMRCRRGLGHRGNEPPQVWYDRNSTCRITPSCSVAAAPVPGKQGSRPSRHNHPTDKRLRGMDQIGENSRQAVGPAPSERFTPLWTAFQLLIGQRAGPMGRRGGLRAIPVPFARPIVMYAR